MVILINKMLWMCEAQQTLSLASLHPQQKYMFGYMPPVMQDKSCVTWNKNIEQGSGYVLVASSITVTGSCELHIEHVYKSTLCL